MHLNIRGLQQPYEDCARVLAPVFLGFKILFLTGLYEGFVQGFGAWPGVRLRLFATRLAAQVALPGNTPETLRG